MIRPVKRPEAPVARKPRASGDDPLADWLMEYGYW